MVRLTQNIRFLAVGLNFNRPHLPENYQHACKNMVCARFQFTCKNSPQYVQKRTAIHSFLFLFSDISIYLLFFLKLTFGSCEMFLINYIHSSHFVFFAIKVFMDDLHGHQIIVLLLNKSKSK